MFGFTIASLMGLFGLTSAFALVGVILAAWMAWRIVAKAGLPGWLGLIAMLLTLTGVGAVVPLVLLWVFAFMEWPRDRGAPVALAAGSVAAPAGGTPGAVAPAVLPPPLAALADRRGWRLNGTAAAGSVSLAFDAASPSYLLAGASSGAANELIVPDPSVASPHARLLMAGTRLGLEDLGSAGGTFIDSARLLPEHGPRDISAARTIRLGTVDLALSRS